MISNPQMKLTLRPAVSADLPALVAVERSAHQAPWSEELLRKELEHAWSTVLLGLDESQALVGYVVFWLVHDEIHILNVATSPPMRRRGVGEFLLSAAEQLGRGKGAVLSTLEVRRSNAPAIGLYRKLGYKEMGVRPRYYADNGEDAFVMTKSFTEA